MPLVFFTLRRVPSLTRLATLDRYPLQLAASLGKLDIFTFIMERRKTVLWKYGDVVCFANSMTEHDTQRTPLAAPSTMEIV
eukprot:369252-Prorocentrum_minimum.AAC.1